MNLASRPFDIVLFGATGFTGRLVAEHLVRAHLGEARLALAGRDERKLSAIRESLAGINPSAATLPLLIANAAEPAALARIAQSTRVIATTVGPYARYGAELVAACAEAGTHYTDITGEVTFVRRTIDRHHDQAKASGARIVPTCGYDSIPSDIGTWFVAKAYVDRYGEQPRAHPTTY